MLSFTVYDLLAKNLDGRADHTALVDGDRRVTYGELARRADALAVWLEDRGVRRRDRVGIHLRKSVEEVVATFAAARLGAVFVNLYPAWTPRQVAHIASDCGMKALVTDARKARLLVEAGVPAPIEHVLFDGELPAGADERMASWADVPRDDAPRAPAPAISPDLAAILYTSGSTGPPKGVMLSHANIVEGARSVARYLKNGPDDRILGFLPLCFDYGLNQLTTMALVGGTLVLHSVFLPPEIVKTLVRERVTGFAAVPPTWIQVARYLLEVRTDLPALRYITSSGGPLPKATLEALPRAFPKAEIYLMYGLTEAFRSTYLDPALYHEKMGAIGRAIPNVETFVVDETQGICGPGEEGELVHRGPLVSLGYWSKPDATAEKIRPCPHLAPMIGDEKVCYSGDIVRIDEDGIYWFVGRKGAFIKPNGLRVSPTEVEDVVYESGLVEHAVAFGVEDEALGEAVHVAVSARPGGPLDPKALLAHCRRHLPLYMVPQEVHVLDGDLPRLASGKIDRGAVVAAARARVAARARPGS